jgi:ribosomal protein S18 acetylase RimI-like enzyme
MTVLTYRDLESRDDLLPLFDHAFRWPYNPRTFEKLVRIDPRLKNGPVGFCAVEDRSVIGFVGVLDLATRTLEGRVEYVGGIYGVATLPKCVKKKISTTLMQSAHEHFTDKGYRFSFLTTSHTIIAHSFYEKLGYTDLLESPSAYKVLKTKRDKPAMKEKTAKLDLDKILRIYNKRMGNRTGFVVRDEAYLKMLKSSEGLTAKQSIIDDEGYVLFRKEKNGIWIRELIALRVKEMDKLVGLVEVKARDLVYDRTVFDDVLFQVYKSRGYMVENRSHSVMMVKPLTAQASIKQTFGEKIDVTGLDLF